MAQRLGTSQQQKSKLKSEEKPGHKTIPKKQTIPNGGRSITEPPTTGDGDYEKPLQEQKTEEEVRKLRIANESALRNLFERDLMISILGEIGHSFQSSVVDQAKRKAPTWAAELGIPDKERQIEKMLSDLGEEEITIVMADIERLSDDGVFE